MKHPLHILFLVFGLLTGVVRAQELYYPERGTAWERLATIPDTWNAQGIEDAVAFAKANEYAGSRDLRIAILKGFEREPYHQILGPVKKRGGPAGMILYQGKIVTQWGETDRVDMTFSVTKSFLSTVAGLAVDASLIAHVEDPVVNYVWDATFDGAHNRQITWRQLLEQNSAWQGTLWGGKDWADRPPAEGDVDDWQYARPNKPGTVMEYNDVRVNVLAYSLLHVWRQPLPQVLKEKIMDPIGASPTWRWHGYEDAWVTLDGLHMQSVTGGGHSGGGLFISTSDMARFGLLVARDGRWKDKQLISEDWLRLATQASAPNPNYGFMWWLNNSGPRQWEGIDDEVFYAAGFGGNFIVIDKKRELVIVTRWLEPSKIEAFMQQLMKAIPE